jgi:5-methylthioribose kinase
MHANAELGARVAGLRTKAEVAECLVHGNLTTDAVVVKGGDIKLLANQEATLGACAFDVGVLLAQYLALYHTHMLTELDNVAHRQVSYKMVEAVTSTVDTYLVHMSDALIAGQGSADSDGVGQFVSDVAGFSGVELVRKATTSLTDNASVAILESGLRLIGASHRIKNASLLANIALMLTQ